MPIDAVADMVCLYQPQTNLIFDPVARQNFSVGGAGVGNDYQIDVSFKVPTSLATGWIIARPALSGYNGTDGKVEIADSGSGEDVGLWGKRVEVDALQSPLEASISSEPNLSGGTTFDSFLWHIDDIYYDLVFVQGTHSIQDAIDAEAVWPPGNEVVRARNEGGTFGVTIVGTTTPAETVTLTGGTVRTDATEGTQIAQAFADRANGTWSFGTPSKSWAEIDPATGVIDVAAGGVTDGAGQYTVQLVYDNSGVTGGGVKTQNVLLTVIVPGVGGGATTHDSFVPMPAFNANESAFESVNELVTNIDQLMNNWSSKMASWGLSAGQKPVLKVAPKVMGDFIISGKKGFPQTVHIRGQGPYAHDGWFPNAGTRFHRVRWTDCRDLQLWGCHMEPASTPSGTGQQNVANHRMNSCQRTEWNRCAIGGDVARSEAAAAIRTPNSVNDLVETKSSSNCHFRMSVVCGADSRFFGGTGITSYGIGLHGIIMDQIYADNVSFFNGGDNRDWIHEDIFGWGMWRRPSDIHRDYWQSAVGTLNSSGHVFRRLWMQDLGFWGISGNVSVKLEQGGAGNVAFRHILDDALFFNCGKILDGGFHGQTRVTNCSFWVPCDVDGFENSEHLRKNPPKPENQRWNANTSGISASLAFADYNIQCGTNSTNAATCGPNGEMIADPGFTNYRSYQHPNGDPNYDFSEYANWFANYVGTSSNHKNTAVPRRNGGHIGMLRPAVGSRHHPDYSGPGGRTGAWRRNRDMFSNTPNNPWGWGWPMTEMFFIRFDPFRQAAGAHPSVNWVNDADGIRIAA